MSDGATFEERIGEVLAELSSIEQLSLQRRTAVWLVDRMGFDYADAARALGISLAELRSLLFRARRELQLRLGLALRASGSSTGELRQRGEA